MMGFFKSSTPEPAEVSKQTIQFCVYAILAVAIADILGCMIDVGHALWELGFSNFFTITGIMFVFWTIVQKGVLIACAALIGFAIFKRHRDFAAVALGFCIGHVVIDGPMMIRTGLAVMHFYRLAGTGDGVEPSALIFFEYFLSTLAAIAAAGMLFLMLRKWPTQSKVVV